MAGGCGECAGGEREGCLRSVAEVNTAEARRLELIPILEPELDLYPHPILVTGLLSRQQRTPLAVTGSPIEVGGRGVRADFILAGM